MAKFPLALTRLPLLAVVMLCPLISLWSLVKVSKLTTPSCGVNQVIVMMEKENRVLETDLSETRMKGLFSQIRKYVVEPQRFTPQKYNTNPSKLSSTDYRKVMAYLNGQRVTQDNPTLVSLIRNYYIEMPSLDPYHLDDPDVVEPSFGQTPLVDSRLHYMASTLMANLKSENGFLEGGFYVECGALNGEKGSNSLFFERVRKWNGLLIEADPTNYRALKTKNRKAFTVNACLNPKPYPAEKIVFPQVMFNKAFNMGRAIHDDFVRKWLSNRGIKLDPVPVQCFPLYSILLALNQTTIDFFSLDVEGDEVEILKTIPFDKINIKMLTVEYSHGSGGKDELQYFMESQGYETLVSMERDDGGVKDLIFRKKGLAT
ncbi:protein Star-like [Pecten maximus]|uniref:protein Star-like n=1 Tax=Pecten maximus TaxID=6579 RepID=UPI001458A759|nr:protein Star-like [Pecten maximus]